MLTQNPWIKDTALLAARLLVGVVFVAHGAQKFFQWGVPGTTEAFAGMGVPAPQTSALLVAVVELVGGAALIVGAAAPVAGALLALDMLGAYLLVHAGQGVFVENGGWELVAALGGASIVLAAVGAGRLSIDHLVRSRTGTRTRTAEPATTSA